MMPALIAGLMAFVVTFAAGCSLVPEYHRPEAITADQWKNSPETLPKKEMPIALNWWQKFSAPELDRLMAVALSNNLDLAAARERVEQFRALAKMAGSPLWPAINATGSYEFNDSTNSGSTRSNVNRTNSGNSLWMGQWNMSYEVDLWGALRAGRDSAKNALLSSQFTLEALRLVVMGDVAQSYFAIVALKERKGIAEKNLRNLNEVLAIIVARFEAGGTSGLEVAQQQTEVANASAAITQLDQQIAQAENALAVLLGYAPQQFKVLAISLNVFQIPKANIAKPTRLLDRRPDIRSAETQLIAAHADIGKARAAFYPRLQLGADNIFTAATLSQPAGIAIALASSLTAPIFQGGRLEGELERTLARRTELLESYRKTLLTAYQEVEDALALGQQATRRRESLLSAVAHASEAYRLARDRYLAGATDYQTLLNVQRSWLNAQDSEVQAHVDILTASVRLFKALGSGWNYQ